MSILVKNVDIITCEEENMMLKNGFIGISKDTIELVTTDEKKALNFNAIKTIDGSKMIATPGFVNAHTHSPMTILRNCANDLALEDWLFNHIFPREGKLLENDIYWGSMLGIAEMIKSGTTSFADMYYAVDQTANAVVESGVRANLSVSAFPFTIDENGTSFSDKTSQFQDFYKTWNKSENGRLSVYVLVHSPYIYDKKSMKDSADFAKDIGTGVHIHVLETLKELNDTTTKYGKDAARACLEAGIFDVPCIAAHCVHASTENIDMFNNKAVSVAHNPTSNLKLGSGIANVPYMLEAGVNVALGTDGTASNNNLNMIEEMHLAALIHKGYNMKPTLVSANDALLMATRNGARALGFGENLGIIKEGYKADITLFDRDEIHFTPYNNPISALVYSAQESDVDSVIIDGKVVLEGRELKTIDEERARFEVTRIAEGLV